MEYSSVVNVTAVFPSSKCLQPTPPPSRSVFFTHCPISSISDQSAKGSRAVEVIWDAGAPLRGRAHDDLRGKRSPLPSYDEVANQENSPDQPITVRGGSSGPE